MWEWWWKVRFKDEERMRSLPLPVVRVQLWGHIIYRKMYLTTGNLLNGKAFPTHINKKYLMLLMLTNRKEKNGEPTSHCSLIT